MNFTARGTDNSIFFYLLILTDSSYCTKIKLTITLLTECIGIILSCTGACVWVATGLL